MKSELTQKEAEQKRRRRELYIILAVIPLIALLTYVESNTSLISSDLPIATNILVLALVNINLILLILLVFLVLRNTVKLILERRRSVMGSRLRTKLVVAFLGLTIVPTFILFFFVIGFINKSIDAWFDIRIEESLQESLELAQNYYKESSASALEFSQRLALDIGTADMLSGEGDLSALLQKERGGEGYSSIEVFSDASLRVSSVLEKNLTDDDLILPSQSALLEALEGIAGSFVDTVRDADIVRAASPIHTAGGEKVIGAVVVSKYVPKHLMQKMRDISTAFEDYKQLKLLKNPVKLTYFMTLLIVTLLVVFFSIWIGRYFARQITVPINDLAEGTLAVSSGNLDYKIDVKSEDEIGVLVKSFNRMTGDLKAGKGEVERANLELRRKNIELDQRRHYIEIVLGNVPAGVVSLDKNGDIVSINRMAAEMLGTVEEHALGRHYDAVLGSKGSEIIKEMVSEIKDVGSGTLERQVKLMVGDKTMTVLVIFSALFDEDGNYIGTVAVMDDLTHLLKTQRMYAWKEVARRIAHEIKNPLTPIQLSAQRLRKKYLERFDEDDGVFDDCTKTIIRQVEELKVLVNEFSSFARLPTANPSPNDLNEIVAETLPLYQGGDKRINVHAVTDPGLPELNIDREQIKRVLINLVENAIAAVNGGEGGEVRIETGFDEYKKMASLAVVDTGCGIPPDDKQRLFEPYFSTKKSGTGLGLAIVSNIISDHNGYIRVKDNQPHGTIFTIELPVKAVPI